MVFSGIETYLPCCMMLEQLAPRTNKTSRSKHHLVVTRRKKETLRIYICIHDRKSKEGITRVLTTNELLAVTRKRAMFVLPTVRMVRLRAVPGKHHEEK